MITATSLELLLLLSIAHAPMPWKVWGIVVWVVYLRYSATRALLERIAEWLHDRNNPPPGAA